MAREGFVPVSGGRIWYRLAGDRRSIPLLIIHGGPGYAHNYLKPLEALAFDRPVIFYDQLGCGKSERPNDPQLWRVDRFRDEARALLVALGIESAHLFGHSWGSLLAVEHSLACPETVRGLILSSPCLSVARWVADTAALVARLPDDIQETIYRHQSNGTTQSEAYLAAAREFERRHLCRLDPLPQPMLESRANMNLSIYHALWGPSEFYVTGTLRDYDCTSRLPAIASPVLLTCGRYDEATPQTTAGYSQLIPGAEAITFEHSAHMAHLEEPQPYLEAVQGFLRRIEDR